MTTAGYYRFPTIQGQNIVFVCEDDLWAVPAGGGVARRLTANLGEVSRPFLSPDGRFLAFIGREEGHPEVYVMPAAGGQEKRLTFVGALSLVIGWSRDGRSILFASNAGQPFARLTKIFAVDREGGLPQLLPYGPARALSFGPGKGVVLGRHGADPAGWKRYRGGLVGDIWIDAQGTGQFQRLIRLNGNLSCPMWVGKRIYFLSDHEGIGNLYSCTPEGKDLRRHTDQQEYYARNASTDGHQIVYHSGADLYLYGPAADRNAPVAVEFHSPRVQRNRRFVSAAKYLEEYAPHPQGHSVAITTRGKPFTLGNWEGPVLQHGEPDGVRYRLAAWLNDGKRLLAVTDQDGEESLVVFQADGSKSPRKLSRLDIGRPLELAVSPKKDQVVLHNHRCELVFVDLGTRKLRVMDKSRHGRIEGIAWSPDGRWVAYGMPLTLRRSILKICQLETGETRPLTRPVLRDVAPAFDPEGKYLYFLSYRVFDPVYDNMLFDLNFPRGMRPYLITLQKDLRSPFLPLPKAPEEPAEKEEKAPARKGKKPDKPVHIDLAGIEDRIAAFPVPEGRYDQIRGLPKGKVLFTVFPVEGTLNEDWLPGELPANGTLEMYDFNEQKKETLIGEVSSFRVSADHKTLFYQSGRRLRAVKAGEKPKEEVAKEPPGRKSGWLNPDRIKVSVTPPAEWKQMQREAWRLMRDHFWVPDMSGVNWGKVYHRYSPLLERVTSRSEFSDLMWEMQGELGTSHAYEMGGDYRPEPKYQQGYLAADFAYDEKSGGYRVVHIARGDPWEPGKDSPLHTPGANVREGQILLAIGGRKLGRHLAPQELLVNQAGAEVLLTFSTGRGARTVAVKALKDETPVRYREWVEKNRHYVHEATKESVGYVHIPNMGPLGYAEFHRYYLAEIHHEALLVDVRFNGGGHVSQLLLEKLMRRRVGYDLQRWGDPQPYPTDSVLGPKVALTNEQAGSDGDIFSHCFKLMKLGPLIGKRTWGGVIGIWPRHALVDGSVTTQPEFSFWFEDVGWGVENYGTDPDIEVDIAPQDDAQGRDPQLDRGIAEILKLLQEQPPKKPDFSKRPDLALPELSPRKKG